MNARHLRTYAIALVVFLIIDGVWLGLMSTRFYQPQIGDLLATRITWAPAALFYLLFVGGLLVFVVAPHSSRGGLGTTLWRAALFGVVAYGTYDLTNLATLKDWPLLVTVVDMIWGACLSVLVTFVTLSVDRRIR